MFVKKLIKPLIVLLLGIFFGFYMCNAKTLDIFKTNYKAFQVGVYTSLDAATTYSTKYKNATIIQDNELYRVYIAILKNNNNIESMSKYLDSQGIDYYLKEITIEDKSLKKKINEYESLMNTDNEVVFLEINKMIMKTYKESL